MIKSFLFCCLLTVVNAGFAELSGTLNCNDCLDCGPVNGEIGLCCNKKTMLFFLFL